MNITNYKMNQQQPTATTTEMYNNNELIIEYQQYYYYENVYSAFYCIPDFYFRFSCFNRLPV